MQNLTRARQITQLARVHYLSKMLAQTFRKLKMQTDCEKKLKKNAKVIMKYSNIGQVQKMFI